MPNRISKPKKRKRAPQEDVNQLAHRLVEESTAEAVTEPTTMTKAQISRLMAEMGRKGGKIGGKRRLETMSPEERSQRALKAAQSRWKKKGQG
jgi:hypothetical protein